MASEIGQAIDHMLSGLQTLQQQAQALQQQAQTLPASDVGAVTDALSGAPAAQHFGDSETQTMLMMAVLESQETDGCALSARRWIIQQCDGQALPLGVLGGEHHAAVRVSPRLRTALEAIATQGAILEACDARYTHWVWPTGDRDKLFSSFGRLSSAVCLEQNMNGLRLRVPKIPERLALRFLSRTRPDASAGPMRLSDYALIDQDNLQARPSTVFWLEDGGLVPDYLCAVAYHAGRWWPVVRTSDD